MGSRKDNQTANEEQYKVAGTLQGDSNTTSGVDGLSGLRKAEFCNGETIHPGEPRAQDRLAGKSTLEVLLGE